MPSQPQWKETYLNAEGISENGSPELEEQYFDQLAQQIRKVVDHFQEDNKGIRQRANHAKGLTGFTNAEVNILPEPSFPMDLAHGFLMPGRTYQASIRFSNASAQIEEDDTKPDLRGIALRIETKQGAQDFLMTDAELHHAKDARSAVITVRAGVWKDIMEDLIPDFIPGEDAIAGFTGALPFLVSQLGFKEAISIVKALKRQMKEKVESLATQTFWSRSPIAIGDLEKEAGMAVKYRLRPALQKSDQESIIGEKDLGAELIKRLESSEVKYYLEIQRFKNESDTPIEDPRVSWGGEDSFERIAEVIIPQNSPNDLVSVNEISFNPWNIDLNHFCPLSSMNRCRKKIYEAGAQQRKQ